MKKIIILFILIGLVTSCNIQDKVENSLQNKKIENKEGINFNNVEENFIKLKELNLSKNELIFLNNDLENIFNKNIENLALKKNDYNICNRSSRSNNCKRKLILKNNKIDDCKILVDNRSIISCKNKINKYLAIKNLDNSYCNKIIDKSDNLLNINNCRNKIFIKKAKISLDIKICDKITEKIEKEMCIQNIKLEIKNKSL